MMFIRLKLYALALVCLGAVLFFVVSEADSLENILYDELTCEELLHSYNFNIEVMNDMLVYHDGCLAYISTELYDHDHGALTCSYIKEHALFVQGIVNDVAAVYNIKCAG